MPPPLPRSRTVSPSARDASAVGLPQPSDAFTASSGITPTSSLPYRFDVMGLRLVVPQHEPLSALTRRARSAYLARTVSRTVSADGSTATGSSSHRQVSMSIGNERGVSSPRPAPAGSGRPGHPATAPGQPDRA